MAPTSDAPAADAPPSDAAAAVDAAALDAPSASDAPPAEDTATVDVAANDAGPDVVKPPVDAPVAVDAATLDTPPTTDLPVADVIAPQDVPPPVDAPPTMCTSARMCPGQVCDTARGVCVDCLTMIDCSGGQRCVANRCVDPPPTCRSDRDCSSRNQVCNVSRMECADCVTDRDCAAGQYCTTDSVCRPQVCTPAAATCVGTTRRVCNANGSASTETPCVAGPNATATCTGGGVCGLTCAAGFADCDNNASTGCEADLRSTSSCGACGTRCASGESCIEGRCGVAPCPGTQTRCGGVCVDTQIDAANCGACARTCAVANGIPVCRAGSCQVLSCASGFADCNGNPTDGCEAALDSNPSHCGMCGRACASGGVCVGGVCGSGCNVGEQRCGGTCVNTLTDPAHCGGCNRPCGVGEVCLGGICAFSTMCPSGQTRCGTACVDLATSATNCGACGTVCPAGNGCSSRRCVATSFSWRITWTGTADVDLRVLTPSGVELSYSTLAGADGVHSGDNRVNGPESVTFTNASARGTYYACAIPYSVTTAGSVTWNFSGTPTAAGSRAFSTAAPSSTRCTSNSVYLVHSFTY